MKAAPVDFHTKKLFQYDVAKMHLPSEMLQHCKLARFIWSFEDHDVETKRSRKAICKLPVEPSVFVDQADAFRAFSGFNNKLHRPGLEPALSLRNQLIDHLVLEGASMLFPQLELNLKAS